MLTTPIEDRFAIQDLVSRYALYVDSRRLKEAADLFIDDATFDETQLGFGIFHGKQSILSYYETAMAEWNIIHLMANHLIEFYSGESASGVCFLHAECRSIYTTESRSIYGCYQDEYVKRDGKWFFGSRTVAPLLPIGSGAATK